MGEQVFASMTAEARRLRGLDEAYSVNCPECGTVLAEYLFGVTKFTCRRCKWQGILIRSEPSLVQSAVTLRPGRHEPRP
jgi:transposase